MDWYSLLKEHLKPDLYQYGVPVRHPVLVGIRATNLQTTFLDYQYPEAFITNIKNEKTLIPTSKVKTFSVAKHPVKVWKHLNTTTKSLHIPQDLIKKVEGFEGKMHLVHRLYPYYKDATVSITMQHGTVTGRGQLTRNGTTGYVNVTTGSLHRGFIESNILNFTDLIYVDDSGIEFTIPPAVFRLAVFMDSLVGKTPPPSALSMDLTTFKSIVLDLEPMDFFIIRKEFADFLEMYAEVDLEFKTLCKEKVNKYVERGL